MNSCCKCRDVVLDDSWYGLHKECFVSWFDLKGLCDFIDIIPRSQSLIPLDGKVENTSFFHGAFRKYSSRLGNESYILKVAQKDHPELPATEFLCNEIYKALEIEIPAHYLIRYPDHDYCFVTKNFMSKIPNSSLVHIYHYLDGRDDHNCEKLVQIIGEKTGRRVEQEKFVYLTLADSLIGNHDRHGRNLGFIETPRGFVLAPFYDNPSYVGLDDDRMLGADLQPRGSIFTHLNNRPTMKDYVVEWNRLGYGNVVNEFKEIFSLTKIISIIEKSFIGEKRKKALLRLVTSRGKELCDL